MGIKTTQLPLKAQPLILDSMASCSNEFSGTVTVRVSLTRMEWIISINILNFLYFFQGNRGENSWRN